MAQLSARGCGLQRAGRSNLAIWLTPSWTQAQHDDGVPGQVRPQSPGRMLEWAPASPRGVLVQNKREGGRKCQTGLILARRGSQAPQPLRGWGVTLPPREPGPAVASTPGWPWPNYRLLSQLPHPARPKKKKPKEPPRQLDMVQKPPGSLGSRKPRRGGWRAGNAEGRCPGRGISTGRREGAAPRPLGQDGHTEGQPGNSAQEGHPAPDQIRAPG